MSTYRVGADHSGNGDEDCIKAVCSKLESAGHTTVNLGVTPNLEGKLGAGSPEDIGVFLVNGICLGTIDSCYKSLIVGKKCSHVYFGIPKPIMSEPFNNREALSDKNKKVAIADDDTFSPSDVRALSGKYTVEELFERYDGVDYAYGDTCEEVADAILNGNTDSGATQTSGEGSIMSGWESITDLLKPLDGEAQVLVRGDIVEIKRISVPEVTKLWVFEGVNIIEDSITVYDYTPEIYNTFSIKWGESYENEMELSFDKHKELFGERKTEVNAVYLVPEDEVPTEDTETTETESDTKTEEDKKEDDDFLGGIFNFLGNSGAEESKKLSEESSGASESEETNYVELPITNERDAYLFGLKTVGMAMRKDGHKIECKVIGSEKWQTGEWCHVYIPQFDEECIMFISKCSHEMSADNEWVTSLTLVDYPPSLGHGHSNSPSNEGSEESTSTEDTSTTESTDTGNSEDTEKSNEEEK